MFFPALAVDGEMLACEGNAEGGSGVGCVEGGEWGDTTCVRGSMCGGGGPRDPSCIERKYFVAAWRSCSLSSAVCRLKNKINTFDETLSNYARVRSSTR